MSDFSSPFKEKLIKLLRLAAICNKCSLSCSDIDEEINTIGGLVFVLAGRVPQRGELIKHPLGFEIEIKDADSRRIKKVRLRIKVDKIDR